MAESKEGYHYRMYAHEKDSENFINNSNRFDNIHGTNHGLHLKCCSTEFWYQKTKNIKCLSPNLMFLEVGILEVTDLCG